MTTKATIAQKAARRKLSLLELASDIDNVSKTFNIMGYSRQQFYELRRNFQALESEGLLEKAQGPRNPNPNRFSEQLEQVVLDNCLEFPPYGSLKVRHLLLLRGIHVGVGAIKGVWQRHDIGSRHQCILRLERQVKQTGIYFSDYHIQMLERFDPEFRERHIKANFTGLRFPSRLSMSSMNAYSPSSRSTVLVSRRS